MHIVFMHTVMFDYISNEYILSGIEVDPQEVQAALEQLLLLSSK